MTDLVRTYVQPVLQEPTAIFAFEGWNDAGEAASGALTFINEALRAVPLAEIDSEIFYDFTVARPEIAMDADNQREVHWPGNEFRYGEADATHDVVTCAGVEPHMRWRCFCDCISEILKGAGVRRVVLLGSHLADVVYSQPVQITGIASDPTLLDKLGVQSSSYQGPTGLLGVLGDRFTRDGLEVLSLWAGLPHYINARPNPRGSLALLQVLSEAVGLRFDLDPMYRSAAEFEERISKLVAQDPELSDYVKQLKRRDFAQ